MYCSAPQGLAENLEIFDDIKKVRDKYQPIRERPLMLPKDKLWPPEKSEK